MRNEKDSLVGKLENKEIEDKGVADVRLQFIENSIAQLQEQQEILKQGGRAELLAVEKQLEKFCRK